MTSTLKYTIALLLSASNNSLEIEIVGTVLVALDVFFMVCSILAIVISLIMLRTKIEEFNRQVKSDEACSDFEDDDGGAKSLVRVMPVIKIKSDEASSDFEDDDGGAKSLFRVMPVIKKKK